MKMDEIPTDTLVKRLTEIQKESTHKEEPTAIPIVVPNGDNTYRLDEEALQKVMRENEVEELPAVVVSVAGAFRKGKSFLLNFIIRYLTAKDKENWLGEDEDLLTGFTWRGGSSRETTGILLWSEVFKVTLEDGSQAAVLLMDTQGTFDGESSVRECVTIFALSTMISSIQVYNLSQQIQEDDLQHLALFTEYGRLACEQTDHKPFQCLQFLVRDWSYAYEYELGDKGGKRLLQKKLYESDSKHEDLRKVRDHVQKCFEEISCYLLPHPGLKVACNPNFKGQLSDIEQEFKDHIKLLVPLLLDAEHIKVKNINGSRITCEELVRLFVNYMEVYNTDDLPEPRSMLEATAEVNNMAVMTKCREFYTDEMDKLMKDRRTYMLPDDLDAQHTKMLSNALNKFDKTKKLGGDEFAKEYREQLLQDIEKRKEGYMAINEKKTHESSSRVFVVLSTMSVVLFLFSYILGFIGFVGLASLCWTSCLMCLLIFVVYTTEKLTGHCPTASARLCIFTDIVHDHAVLPMIQYLIARGSDFFINKMTNSSLTQSQTKLKTN